MVERLCTAAMDSYPLGVATRPIPKLFWTVLFLPYADSAA